MFFFPTVFHRFRMEITPTGRKICLRICGFGIEIKQQPTGTYLAVCQIVNRKNWVLHFELEFTVIRS